MRRSRTSIGSWLSPPPVVEAPAKAPIETSGAMRIAVASAALTARMRRRSQRMELGKVTSGPRSASAAASTLLAVLTTAMLSSTEISEPGRLRENREAG